jgi:hypothetical protein
MKKHLLGVVCACIFSLATIITNAAVLPLESRLGGLAYYDPNLNITWAADANINGLESQGTHVLLAETLTIGGVSGWRLPSADVNGDGTVVDCFGGGVAGCADSEMGFLFWEEGITDTAPGPFSNVAQSDVVYWSGTLAPDPAEAWFLNFNTGVQRTNLTGFAVSGWYVHDGNVVPIPAAIWLFGSGLLGLIGVAKRKKAA